MNNNQVYTFTDYANNQMHKYKFNKNSSGFSYTVLVSYNFGG